MVQGTAHRKFVQGSGKENTFGIVIRSLNLNQHTVFESQIRGQTNQCGSVTVGFPWLFSKLIFLGDDHCRVVFLWRFACQQDLGRYAPMSPSSPSKDSSTSRLWSNRWRRFRCSEFIRRRPTPCLVPCKLLPSPTNPFVCKVCVYETSIWEGKRREA